MNNIVKLLIEMVVVGVCLAILGLPVSYAFDYYNDRRINWWPKHVYGMLIGTFATGALFHFICEVTGLNEWYVKQYKRLL
jgi:H+/Cl- antiporter ClcA